MTGLAVDISILGADNKPDDHKRGRLVAAAIKCGAKGIGIAKTFVHLDIKERANGPLAMWLY